MCGVYVKVKKRVCNVLKCGITDRSWLDLHAALLGINHETQWMARLDLETYSHSTSNSP